MSITRSPLLITGAPRSGKTMIAGILQICGVFAGEVDKMAENQEIMEKVLQPYLVRHGGDPRGLKPLVPTSELSIFGGWQESVENIMLSQGYDGQKWMIKTSKIALTWPAWKYAYPDAKFIIVRRRTGDIVQSCLKTGYMDAYQDDAGWISMIRDYEQRFVEMISEGTNCKIIWPHRMVYGDYAQVYELLEWLGLPWKSEILTHVDPKFWKTRRKEK